jgi:hypothetical protein
MALGDPNPAWKSWFGGCGELDCTGPKNFLIYDKDGKFFGKPSQAIPHNELVGANVPKCVFNQHWNGYECDTTDFAIVEFESTAPDFQKIVAWPVFLNNGLYTNEINAWREWSWIGPEPQNARMNRFVALTQLNKILNVTYNGTNPADIHHKI